MANETAIANVLDLVASTYGEDYGLEDIAAMLADLASVAHAHGVRHAGTLSAIHALMLSVVDEASRE